MSLFPVLNLSDEKYAIVEMRMKNNNQNYKFLDSDETLIDVVCRDHELLETLNITHKQIADQLNAMIKKGNFICKDYESDGALIDGRYRFSFKIMTKHIHCPFEARETCEWNRTIYTFKDLKTRRKIQVTGLLVHLIGVHGFFLGKKSPHRLDPKEISAFFEIKPDVDYFLPVITYEFKRWELIYTSDNVEEGLERKVDREAKVFDESYTHLRGYSLKTVVGCLKAAIKEDSNTDETFRGPYLHLFIDKEYPRTPEVCNFRFSHADLTLINPGTFAIYKRVKTTIEEVVLSPLDKPYMLKKK